MTTPAPRDSHDDAMHQLLMAALPARPEHTPAIDIAVAALTRGHAANAQLLRLARLAKWTRLAGAAAILLIAATMFLGYSFWPASTTTTAVAATTVTSPSTIDLTTLAIAAILTAIIAFTLLTLFTPDRPTYRLSPA